MDKKSLDVEFYILGSFFLILVIVLGFEWYLTGDDEVIVGTVLAGAAMLLTQFLAMRGDGKLTDPHSGHEKYLAPITGGLALGSLVAGHGLVLNEFAEDFFRNGEIALVFVGLGVVIWVLFAVYFIRKGNQLTRGEFFRAFLLWTGAATVFSGFWGAAAMFVLSERGGFLAGISGAILMLWSGIVLIWFLAPLIYFLVLRYREGQNP